MRDTPVPHRNAVRNLVDEFWEIGSVDDVKRCGRPAKPSEEKLLDISDSVMQSPSKSLRKLAQQHDIGLGSAHKAVKKKLKLFPYKIMAVQKLKATDNEKRKRYCRWFNRFIEENTANVLDVTFFTDEAWFQLSGYINSQNSRLWSSDNSHSLHETPLYYFKVGVWVTISRRRIVGPIFFINSERYCSEILHTFIGQMTSDEINYSWFQQDGATAHTPHRYMRLLKE
ncbi:uncharacterized protein LOC143236352 [Tachypleus tridentatus]|uniref:uncharacterized protein LOC143236352 n=1 Tax=Tachypleus tridentatus TaxID=6853 RepID=UPI003FD6BC2A